MKINIEWLSKDGGRTYWLSFWLLRDDAPAQEWNRALLDTVKLTRRAKLRKWEVTNLFPGSNKEVQLELSKAGSDLFEGWTADERSQNMRELSRIVHSYFTGRIPKRNVTLQEML